MKVNGEFLQKVADSPNLAERLAQRQMKIIRQGTRVLELKGGREDEMSPFHLVNVAPPSRCRRTAPAAARSRNSASTRAPAST